MKSCDLFVSPITVNIHSTDSRAYIVHSEHRRNIIKYTLSTTVRAIGYGRGVSIPRIIRDQRDQHVPWSYTLYARGIHYIINELISYRMRQTVVQS